MGTSVKKIQLICLAAVLCQTGCATSALLDRPVPMCVKTANTARAVVELKGEIHDHVCERGPNSITPWAVTPTPEMIQKCDAALERDLARNECALDLHCTCWPEVRRQAGNVVGMPFAVAFDIASIPVFGLMGIAMIISGEPLIHLDL